MKARLSALLLATLMLTHHAQGATNENNEPVAVTSQASQFDTPLMTSDSLKATPTPVRAQRTQDHRSQTPGPDFWIYDSWVSLYDDIDADGYYSTLQVTLDADTVYNAANVYAVIFIGRNDTYDSVYTTSVFTIYADDSDDALTVDSELMTGFPPREYHVLIELYDTDTGELVAYTDDYDDADLSFLSLESRNHERQYSENVVVVEQHGGSASLLGLAALLIVTAGLRIWRHQH